MSRDNSVNLHECFPIWKGNHLFLFDEDMRILIGEALNYFQM